MGETVSERPLLVTEIMDFSFNNARLYNSRGPPLSEREICVFYLDVARAPNYLYQKEPRIIHRDISCMC